MFTRTFFRQVLSAAPSLLFLAACNTEVDSASSDSSSAPDPMPTSEVIVKGPGGTPVLPSELGDSPKPTDAGTADAAPPAHEGPWFIVTEPSVGIYADKTFDRKLKIGYARSGGRIPVKPTPQKDKNCSKGWHELVDGGFICGNSGTTNENDPEARFTMKPPNLDEILPYAYARNAKNGTPLYKSVPSPEQMQQYEPYLLKDKEEKGDKGDKEKASKTASSDKSEKPETVSRTAPNDAVVKTDLLARETELRVKTERPRGDESRLEDRTAAPSNEADAGAETAETAPEEPPWWQREDSKEALHNFELEQLHADADDVLAKRLVSGFYVAVNNVFRWNNRAWYKTTQGFVAPMDRFWQTAGPKFQGVELDQSEWKLPLGWVYGRKNTSSYVIDAEAKKITPAKTYERMAVIRLTEETTEYAGKRYQKDVLGQWIRTDHLRITEPGPPPPDVGPNEAWIDVDISSQTLVAFRGGAAVYATLISSGKESKIKEKDHRTPRGTFRIREKHVTTKMDGDGTASDLPYSIEDVPYVMYFRDAYALHGAFWHQNYGSQMSHGCVNLAPLDAKWLYFFAGPVSHRGWHGAWADPSRPGSYVLLHD